AATEDNDRALRRCGRGCDRETPAATRPRSRSAALPIVAAERGRRRLQLAAFVENLDAPLGILEPGVAEAGQLHPAFVELQRLLEREIAVLGLLDDRLELGNRRFEVLDGGVAHAVSVTLAVISPRLKVTWMVSPGAADPASRSTAVLSAFQATA